MALFRSTRLFSKCLSKNYISAFSTTIQPKNDGLNSSENVFPGCKAPFTNELVFTDQKNYDPIPIYRVLHNTGEIDSNEDPKLSQDMVVKMYKDMTLLNTMDKILYESQRQGRISFYMTNYGEEGLQIGSAAALSPEDLIYAQYRECGIFLWRGTPIGGLIDQCYGNIDDPGKGKQMPVHYGSRHLNICTISSPLGTQLPQAAGSAYAFKLTQNNERCVMCYFGDGSASEGDAHPAFNFAATLDCPVIFFCRNNGFAISTSTDEQYRGDGIAGRGPAFGIKTIRVDGTDIFAVYNATKMAREYAIKNNKPVLIEAMAYRIGHHSTSDDSSAYRNMAELTKWNTTESPIGKLRLFMESKYWWNQDMENAWIAESKQNVLSTIKDSEKKMKPNWREMFSDVYYDTPNHIQKQMKEMEKHLQKYKEHYPLANFKTD